MNKLTRDFILDNEVVFIGYSGRNQAFSSEIYKAFSRNGIKVYPVNNKADGTYDVKVYRSIADLPKIPKCAFVLLNKDNSRKAVQTLADNGIKRVLFQNKKAVDSDTLSECDKLGIEAVVGCPMMIYGKGLHKIHAFFAGVK